MTDAKPPIQGVISALRGRTRPPSEPPGVPKGWAAASDHSAVRLCVAPWAFYPQKSAKTGTRQPGQL
jgi:hypothetical protein